MKGVTSAATTLVDGWRDCFPLRDDHQDRLPASESGPPAMDFQSSKSRTTIDGRTQGSKITGI